MWWYIPVIPALRRLRQENYKFKASLCYIERPCLQFRERKREKKKEGEEKGEEEKRRGKER
jgi:hypothetical protein